MPKSGAMRSREPGAELRGDSGDAEAADLAMQAVRVPGEEKRDVAERAKERHCDRGGAVPSKMLQLVLPSTAHQNTCLTLMGGASSSG